MQTGRKQVQQTPQPCVWLSSAAPPEEGSEPAVCKRTLTASYGAARGALLKVTCQPGWEEGVGENGYVCMHA